MSQVEFPTFQREHLTIADNARQDAARELESFAEPNLRTGLAVTVAAILVILVLLLSHVLDKKSSGAA